MQLIAVMVLCATVAVSAAASPGAPLATAELEAFNARYAAHRLNPAGWSGTFHQEVRSPALLEPIVSSGNLTYRAPATLELNYTAPQAGQVWTRQGETGQSFPGRAPQNPATSLVRSLLDFFRLPPDAWQKDYTATAQRLGELVFIALASKPGAPASQPSRILVEVHALTLDPSRLEIVFAEQTSLTFVFANWHTPGPPPTPAAAPPAHEPPVAPTRPRLYPGR